MRFKMITQRELGQREYCYGGQRSSSLMIFFFFFLRPSSPPLEPIMRLDVSARCLLAHRLSGITLG